MFKLHLIKLYFSFLIVNCAKMTLRAFLTPNFKNLSYLLIFHIVTKNYIYTHTHVNFMSGNRSIPTRLVLADINSYPNQFPSGSIPTRSVPIRFNSHLSVSHWEIFLHSCCFSTNYQFFYDSTLHKSFCLHGINVLLVSYFTLVAIFARLIFFISIIKLRWRNLSKYIDKKIKVVVNVNFISLIK